jgi:hypothetical protein
MKLDLREAFSQGDKRLRARSVAAEKDAFLPNLVRVYGFIKAQAYTIWRLQIKLGLQIISISQSVNLCAF